MQMLQKKINNTSSSKLDRKNYLDITFARLSFKKMINFFVSAVTKTLNCWYNFKAATDFDI